MRDVDIAVIGAGPAGCAAALTAARLGASVTLIDEGEAPGGQLRWTLARQSGLPEPYDGTRGVEIAERLATDLTAAGVDVRCGSVVWGVFDDHVLGVVSGASSEALRARRIILATGSTDIAYPFPGWELPGVLMATAVFKLLHRYRVRPGSRAVVLGTGHQADAVSDDLSLCGVEVVARAEALTGVRVAGTGAVESVVIDNERLDVDLVVLAFGRQPDPELAQQAMCEIGYSALDGVFVPLRDSALSTSQPGIFAVGDCAGICTAAEAWAEGALAALGATGQAGEEDARSRLRELRSAARVDQVARLQLPASVAGVSEGQRS